MKNSETQLVRPGSGHGIARLVRPHHHRAQVEAQEHAQKQQHHGRLQERVCIGEGHFLHPQARVIGILENEFPVPHGDGLPGGHGHIRHGDAVAHQAHLVEHGLLRRGIVLVLRLEGA